MSRKKIHSISIAPNCCINVYRDAEWDEYVVKTVVDGKTVAEGFESDKQSALDTAEASAEWALGRCGKGLSEVKRAPKMLTTGEEDFIYFLQNTLIPDLKESGYDYTATDLEDGIQYLGQVVNGKGSQAKIGGFVAYLKDTLIPDLKEGGRVETAKDFTRLKNLIVKYAVYRS